jgi:carboxylesterase type B
VERAASGHAELLPVVVYIHGGGFILGSGSNPSTSPPPDHFVISSDVVFVTFNYRLGPFSFISSAAMENYGGMLGIWDQVVALQWVNEYIHAFGGDSSNITLMGESAGAISICTHLVLPASRGLFQKAIMESALCGFPFDGPASARKTMLKLADALNCAVNATDPQQHGILAKARENLIGIGVLNKSRHKVAQPVEGQVEAPAGWMNRILRPLERARSAWNELVHITLSPITSSTTDSKEDSTTDVHFEFLRNVASSGVAALQALGNQLGAVWSIDDATKATEELDTMSKRNSKWNIHSQGRFQRVHDIPDQPNPYATPSLSQDEIAADHLMLQCMRSKSAEEVRNALQVRRGFMFYTGEAFFPVVNGIDIADHPMRLIEKGQWAKDVEMLYGHNKDEASIFLLFAYPFLMTENLVKGKQAATLLSPSTPAPRAVA